MKQIIQFNIILLHVNTAALQLFPPELAVTSFVNEDFMKGVYFAIDDFWIPIGTYANTTCPSYFSISILVPFFLIGMILYYNPPQDTINPALLDMSETGNTREVSSPVNLVAVLYNNKTSALICDTNKPTGERMLALFRRGQQTTLEGRTGFLIDEVTYRTADSVLVQVDIAGLNFLDSVHGVFSKNKPLERRSEICYARDPVVHVVVHVL